MTTVKLRGKVNFPATVTATGGLGISKALGIWTVTPQWSDLTLETTIPNPSGRELWTHDPVADVYYRLSVQALINSLPTGPSAWLPVVAWMTAIAYVSVAPASVVTFGGETYVCLIAHTSGTFATDLGAGKWIKIAAAGTAGSNGAGYGGTSTTSLLIANSTTKGFTTQAGLAYLVGNYARASSAANGANFMEGLVSAYSGTSLSIAVSKIGGTGTFADWSFQVAGAPGTGDMLSTNNLSDVANAATARGNLAAAPLASPTFTGTPAAPTAAVDTNTTQLATTAMVLAQAASATPLPNNATAAVGTSTRFARADHVHAGDPAGQARANYVHYLFLA